MSIYPGLPRRALDKPFDSVCDCYDNAMMFYWNQANEEMMDSYISQITELGYALYQELDNDCIRSATYQKDTTAIHIYYLKKTTALRAIVQDNAVLPPNDDVYQKVCDVAVTQTGLYEDPRVYTSMGYLIRLEDGTFVVIDGGKNFDSHADRLYDTMLAQKPSDVDDIVISAWIITHGHSDHYGVYRNFAKRYSDKVKVKMLVGNDISDIMYQACSWGRNFNYSTSCNCFEGCVYMKAHTGQQFRFPGITMTVLYTQEDYYPEMMRNYNNTSMVIDAVVKGEATREPVKKGETRFIWLADVHPEGAQCVINAYGDDIKCDVMQISHHGIGCYLYDLYVLCKPRMAYWPCGRDVLEYKNGKRLQRPHLKYLLETTDKIIYRVGGDHTFLFGDTVTEQE